jgi:hypothetical protein
VFLRACSSDNIEGAFLLKSFLFRKRLGAASPVQVEIDGARGLLHFGAAQGKPVHRDG